MRYRIEVSPTRNGAARVNFPGRVMALEARRHAGPVWLVGVSDIGGSGSGSGSGAQEGSVTVQANSAGEAVWRVAQAAVRAVAELTGADVIEGDAAAASPADRPGGSNHP